jgi:hypothetical protein
MFSMKYELNHYSYKIKINFGLQYEKIYQDDRAVPRELHIRKKSVDLRALLYVQRASVHP